LRLTVSVVLFLGLIFGVVLPAILKSWSILPALVMRKVTLPCGALVGRRVNLNSLPVTVTLVFAALADG
jgi:hypothetical protein